MSLPLWFPAPGAVLEDGFLNLGFDVFWHSPITDPKVSMLIQLTLASRDDGGALVDEYCVAWSRLSLSQVRSDAVPAADPSRAHARLYHSTFAGSD